MQKAKAFFFVCAGLLCLELGYFMGFVIMTAHRTGWEIPVRADVEVSGNLSTDVSGDLLTDVSGDLSVSR